ncbi:uncharacterized protein JCM6883_004729 [Sporobolomyces salmoneus]|uniref:uncharacterized protein n=1 Tax=Sporobolomyces salmoneus TaxID=183962 RepID=UPI00317C8178
MSQPSFSRAPGSQFQPTPPRSGLSSPSSFFPSSSSSSLDPFSSNTSTSAISPSSSPVEFRTTFSGGAHSPALSPGTGGQPSYGILDNTRPYPLVERRSFRDASSAGDVVVSREELFANGNNLGSSGAGAVGEQRRQSSMGPGAIGDARRSLTPSPSVERSQEELALNLPAGILDSLAAPSSANSDAGGGGGPQNQVKSRPSSFILDVLPQSRERTSGANTPSLSLDSVSQAPSTSSTSDVPFLHSPNNLAPIPHQSSQFFQNPNSASSTTSLVSTSGGGGLNVFSNSRSSSPGPLEMYNNNGSSSSGVPHSSSFESLSTKVNNLESNVSDLSSLLATEFKGLREEVSFLRSLVYQQQQQQPSTRPSFDHRQSHERETDSPLLTLRSPSPHHSPAFPQPIPLSRGNSFQGSGSNHSNSTLLASTSPLSPHSAPINFFQPPHGNVAQPDDLKDKQIELLTQQVNSLTSTVSNLLSSNGHGLHGFSTSPGGIGGNPVRQAVKAERAAAAAGGGGGPASIGMSSRQLSLPVSISGNSMLESAGGLNNGWKRETLGASSGLGVTTPGGSLLGGGSGNGKGGTGLRSVSQGGLGRSASLRSSQLPGGAGSGGGLRMEQGSFDTISSSSAWEGGISSPMLGAGPPSAVNSPMLGSGGQPGPTANPPGSLGSKWELLGIGNDLFRAVAKYGLGPPTKIQSKSIPCVVRGQDVVAQAPAIQERIQSYVIPMLQLIFTQASLLAQQSSFDSQPPAPRGIQAIVITATVDQSAQAQRLAVGLGGSLGIRTSLCVGAGGGDIQNELQTLLKAPPHILVGTPQKMLDLFQTRALPTNDVRLLVIDECDQLIARNLSDFVLQLSKLLPASSSSFNSSTSVHGSPTTSRSQLPGAFDSAPMARYGSNASLASTAQQSTVERQVAIFSCTVPQDVLNFASTLQLKEPVRVLVRRNDGGDGSSPSMRSLKQYYLYLAVGSAAKGSKVIGAGRLEATNAREWKLEALADLCEDHTFDHAVIFASSPENIEAIQYKLGTRSIEAHALHQELSTSARQQVITKFRSTAPPRPGVSPKKVLVIYDALSRNLADVQQVGLVINFDLPRAVEDYIHRISCASTSSSNFAPKTSSMILNIVTPSEVDMLRSIESFYRCKIQELPPNFATSSN